MVSPIQRSTVAQIMGPVMQSWDKPGFDNTHDLNAKPAPGQG